MIKGFTYSPRKRIFDRPRECLPGEYVDRLMMTDEEAMEILQSAGRKEFGDLTYEETRLRGLPHYLVDIIGGAWAALTGRSTNGQPAAR